MKAKQKPKPANSQVTFMEVTLRKAINTRLVK